MNEQAVLTIDPASTKRKIKAAGLTVASYARVQGLVAGTFGRIMAGTYPCVEDVDSEYQKILQMLKRDGYLVEAPAAQSKAA